MADNHDDLYEIGYRRFSDQTIRRFLLGDLGASDRPAFEESLLADDDLDARVRLVEVELVDDYAFERLNSGDRKLFEEKFLLTTDRQDKLGVSNALRDRFATNRARTSVVGRAKVVGRLRQLFGLERPEWKIAYGVLILLILVGTILLIIRKPRLAQRFIPRRAPAVAPTPAQPSTAHHSTNQSPAPVHREPSPSLPAHEPGTRPVVAVFVLTPNRRETATIPVIDLPQRKDEIVRFQLALKPDASGTFRVELLTDDGRSVLKEESLSADGSTRAIDFEVPARLLKTGNYQIRINSGSRADAGEVTYYFLVR